MSDPGKGGTVPLFTQGEARALFDSSIREVISDEKLTRLRAENEALKAEKADKAELVEALEDLGRGPLFRLLAANEALWSGILIDDLAGAIADEIMTMGGTGDVADRLVLEKEGKALGGRIRSCVIDDIKSAMWEKKTQ